MTRGDFPENHRGLYHWYAYALRGDRFPYVLDTCRCRISENAEGSHPSFPHNTPLPPLPPDRPLPLLQTWETDDPLDENAIPPLLPYISSPFDLLRSRDGTRRTALPLRRRHVLVLVHFLDPGFSRRLLPFRLSPSHTRFSLIRLLRSSSSTGTSINRRVGVPLHSPGHIISLILFLSGKEDVDRVHVVGHPPHVTNPDGHQIEGKADYGFAWVGGDVVGRGSGKFGISLREMVEEGMPSVHPERR